MQVGSRRVAFVDANRIAVRIVDERHAADGRWEWFHVKLHAVCLQVRDGGVEILDFKADGAAFGGGLPTGLAGAEAKRAISDLVFRPLHPAGFAMSHGRCQAQHAFVKLPRPRHIGDGVTTERDFADTNHGVSCFKTGCEQGSQIETGPLSEP